MADQPEPEFSDAVEELAECARYGEEADVKELLAAAASAATLVNKPAANGSTALHMAAANGHVAICECLLEAGAATGTKNGSASTALHWAAMNGHTGVVSLLLERGASAFETNDLGQLAMDCAIAAGWDEVATVIRLAGQAKVEANEAMRLAHSHVIFLSCCHFADFTCGWQEKAEDFCSAGRHAGQLASRRDCRRGDCRRGVLLSCSG